MFYNECFCLKWKRNEPNRNEPKSTRNRTETSRTETEPTRTENEPERTEQTQNKNTKTISTFIIKHYGFAISLLKERWNTHFDFQSDCRSIVYRMLDVIFLREWMEPAGHAAGWLDLWWKRATVFSCLAARTSVESSVLKMHSCAALSCHWAKPSVWLEHFSSRDARKNHVRFL